MLVNVLANRNVKSGVHIESDFSSSKGCASMFGGKEKGRELRREIILSNSITSQIEVTTKLAQ